MAKFRLIYHFMRTNIFYRPFSKRMGRRVIIVNPLLITPAYLECGNHIFVRDGARIEGVGRYLDKTYQPQIIFEDGVAIEQHLHLTAAGKVHIGRNTAIAANVTISDINHPYTDITLAPEKQQIAVKEVSIGEDCKIYNNVVILPGVKLGKHCIVGANSVVPGKDYGDYCVIAGAPAKVVRKYSFEKGEWMRVDDNGQFI